MLFPGGGGVRGGPGAGKCVDEGEGDVTDMSADSTLSTDEESDAREEEEGGGEDYDDLLFSDDEDGETGTSTAGVMGRRNSAVPDLQQHPIVGMLLWMLQPPKNNQNAAAAAGRSGETCVREPAGGNAARRAIRDAERAKRRQERERALRRRQQQQQQQQRKGRQGRQGPAPASMVLDSRNTTAKSLIGKQGAYDLPPGGGRGGARNGVRAAEEEEDDDEELDDASDSEGEDAEGGETKKRGRDAVDLDGVDDYGEVERASFSSKSTFTPEYGFYVPITPPQPSFSPNSNTSSAGSSLRYPRKASGVDSQAKTGKRGGETEAGEVAQPPPTAADAPSGVVGSLGKVIYWSTAHLLKWVSEDSASPSPAPAAAPAAATAAAAAAAATTASTASTESTTFGMGMRTSQSTQLDTVLEDHEQRQPSEPR